MSTIERPAIPVAEGFYVTGGTLPADAPSYVPRQADHDLLDALTQGEFCYVLNTRQMGKSSLMVRTAQALRERGDTVTVLDLTAVGLNLTPEQWYDGLLASFAEQLHLEDALEDFWDQNAKLGPLQRFMTAIRQVALPHIPQRLVVFVDEIDAVRSLPFPADEFFAAIRECYNRRTQDPAYEKLTFCLLGVATPADLISDTRMSPFNIGRRIALTDFTPAEAAPLASAISGGREQLDRVLYWTGGHPYMTQRLCRAVAEEGVTSVGGVDAACERLFLTKQARETDDNLAFVRNRLLRSEADLSSLLDLYTQVRARRKVKDDETNPLCGVLRLSGVVNAPEGYLRVRNRVYDRVFAREWVLAHMPGAELRRQRAAYRRGLARAAAVASGVLLLMGLLSAWALSEAHRANGSARRARTALSAEQVAEGRARDEASAANQAAGAARAADGQAQEQRQIAVGQKRLAQAGALEARRQKGRAQTNEQAAVTERGRATTAAGQARAQAQIARRETGEAQVQTRNAQRQQQLGDLQLAGQTWDSPEVTASSVTALLASSRAANAGSDRERFEWRYLWNQLHNSSTATYAPPNLQDLGVTDEGVLTVLSGGGLLTRMRASDRHLISQVSLPTKIPGFLRAAVSHDGTQIAVASKDDRIALLDAATLRPERSLVARIGVSSTLTYPNRAGRLLLASLDDGTVRLWDSRSGKEIGRWTRKVFAATGPIYESRTGLSTISDDGRWRAVTNFPHTGQVMLSDLSLLTVKGYTPTVLDSIGAYAYSTAFSPDGSMLATTDLNGNVVLFQTATGREIRRWQSGTIQFTDMEFSPDADSLAAGDLDGLIRLWDLRAPSTAPARMLKGHTAPIINLWFSPEGRWLASSDSFGVAKVWDLSAGDAPVLKPSNHLISWLKYSPDSKTLTVFPALVGNPYAFQDSSLVNLSAVTGRSAPLPEYLRATKGDGARRIYDFAYSPDGRTVATAGLLLLPAHPAVAGHLTLARGRYFVQLSDRRTGRRKFCWQDPATVTDRDPKVAGAPQQVYFVDNGRLLISVLGTSGQGRLPVVRVWDTVTGRQVRTLDGITDPSIGLRLSPDGKTLLVSTAAGNASLLSNGSNVLRYDTRSWLETGRLDSRSYLTATAFSPDGRLWASEFLGDNVDGEVAVWDTRTWQVLWSQPGSWPVYDVAFSPDGQTLAETCYNHTVKLRDARTGRLTRVLSGFVDLPNSLAFSPDGTQLAVGERGGEIRIFRAASDAQVAAWERQEGAAPAQTASRTTQWTTPETPEQTAALLREITAHHVPGYARPDPAANLLRPDRHGTRWRVWLTNFWHFDTPQPGNATGTLHVGPGDMATANVTRVDGSDWHVELGQAGLSLIPGRRYVFQFRARATQPVMIRLNTQADAPPYAHNGLEEDELTLTPRWQAFRFPFTMAATPGTSSLSICVGQYINHISFADAVLVPEKGKKP